MQSMAIFLRNIPQMTQRVIQKGGLSNHIKSLNTNFFSFGRLENFGCRLIHISGIQNSDLNVLALRGGPYRCTRQHIREFFEEANIDIVDVSCRTSDGLYFVKLRSGVDAENAMKERNRQYIDNRYIELKPVKESKFTMANDMQDIMNNGMFVLKMLGLPYECEEEAIRNFFAPTEYKRLAIEPAFHLNGNGLALVEFNNQQDMLVARKKDRTSIGDRYIVLAVYTRDGRERI